MAPRAQTVRMSGAERRELIIEAALEGFAAHGYHGISLNDIAATAGITKAVLYDHFDSKRDLHIFLLYKICDEMAEEVVAGSTKDGGPESRLRGGIDAFFAFIEERPAARLLFREDSLDPQIVEARQATQQRATDTIAELFAGDPRLLPEAKTREGWIGLLAELVKGGLYGLAIWSLERPTVERQTLVDAAVTLYWTGLEQLYAGLTEEV
jgi:AcrR family transcriptional regulator